MLNNVFNKYDYLLNEQCTDSLNEIVIYKRYKPYK